MVQRILAALCLVGLIGADAVYGQARDVAIFYHESLENLAFDAPPPANGIVAADLPDARLLFTAFGRRFDLVLEPNVRLLQDMTPAQARAFQRVEVYRGGLVGLPESWVRIARHAGNITGVVWDGADLFAIEQRVDVQRFLMSPDSGGDAVVYRARDTKGGWYDTLLYPPTHAPLPREGAASGESGPVALAATVFPARRLSIALLANQEFASISQPNAEGQLLAMANIIDGIFFWQVGVEIAIGELRILEQATDPLTASSPAELLTQLQEYRENTPTQRELGLTHFFSGRELIEESEGNAEIIGIANFGSLCHSRYGVGLTQATFGQLQSALIAAHEIAHNFGAPHDGEEGSPCVSAPPGLMAPNFNGSDTFSQCSIDQMTPEIAAADCMVEIAANDLVLTLREAPEIIDYGQRFKVSVNVEATGPQDARGLEITFDIESLQYHFFSTGEGGSSWECEQISTTLRCRRDTMPAGSASRLEITLTQNTRAPVTLPITLTSLTDPNDTNNALTLQIPIIPDIEIVAAMSADRLELKPLESAELVATISNTGTETAAQVQVTVHSPQLVTIETLDLQTGTCGPPDPFGVRLCNIGDIPGGAQRAITIRFSGSVNPGLPGDRVWEFVSIGIIATTEIDGIEVRRDNAVTNVAISERFVDIAAMIEGPVETAPGASAEFRVTWINRGPDDAVGPYLELYVGTALSVTSFAASHEGCEARQSVTITCVVERLAPGESLALTVTGTMPQFGALQIHARGWWLEWDLEQGNNATAHDTYVRETAPPPPGPTPTPPPPPLPEPPPQVPPTQSPPPETSVPQTPPPSSSSGGGGTVSPLVVLILLLLRLKPGRRRFAATGHVKVAGA